MTFKEALSKIKTMGEADKFSPKQVYSILADLGAFKECPKLQLITKIALSNGLCDILFSSTSITEKANSLKKKLEYNGFSETYITQLFNLCHIAIKIENHTCDFIQCNKTVTSEDRLSLYPDTNSELDIYKKTEGAIFIIDKRSFKSHGLKLQDLNIEHCNFESGYVNMSYEVVGKRGAKGCSLDLKVLDNNGFIREIIKIGDLKIYDEYSICSNSITCNIKLNPNSISKIILSCGYPRYASDSHPDSYSSLLNESNVESYDGIIEDKLKNIKINQIQILGNSKENAEISFYIEYQTVVGKFQYPSKRTILASLYDKTGKLRQQCCVKRLCYIIRNEDRFNFSSRISRNLLDTYDNTLIIPFSEISKITLTEKYAV